MPHLTDKRLNEILVRDFNRYTMGLWAKPFAPGMFPEDIENCDWRCGHRGPYPRFWRYVKHAACHWIVNFALRLAELSEPNKRWRIVAGDKHSTVWDGSKVLFEFNYQALGVTPEECWENARCDGFISEPGIEEPCGLTPPWFMDDLEDPKRLATQDRRSLEMKIAAVSLYVERLVANQESLRDVTMMDVYGLQEDLILYGATIHKHMQQWLADGEEPPRFPVLLLSSPTSTDKSEADGGNRC